jgi:small subunit ribosomal protein S19
MTRSLKKWFYVNPKILKKIQKMEETGQKKPIKVWDRACTIVPEMVGYTFAVHNGKEFVSVYVNDDMIGYRPVSYTHLTLPTIA